MTKENVNLDKINLTWCLDIFERIQKVIKDPNSTQTEKIQSIEWLVKQGLKASREE